MSKDISAQSLQAKAVQDALDGKSKGFKRLLPFFRPRLYRGDCLH